MKVTAITFSCEITVTTERKGGLRNRSFLDSFTYIEEDHSEQNTCREDNQQASCHHLKPTPRSGVKEEADEQHRILYEGQDE